MATDLELAVATLLVKKAQHDLYMDYYQGDQPLIYSRDKLRDIFKNLDANFTENWCAVVIDSELDRIQLQRITVAENDAATNKLDDILKSSRLLIESKAVHKTAIVTGEAYVIAWKDEAVEGQISKPEAYYNDPRNTHIFYYADKPHVKRFACKWWLGDDQYRYLTLYYSDRLEYYRSSRKIKSNETVSVETYPKTFLPYSEKGQAVVDNPYDIPVFHFRRDQERIISELKNIVPIQDAINKLNADEMIAAEFGAFPQRWTISQGDPGVLLTGPGKIWNIPAGEGDGQSTSVGQFPATDLTNYINAIEKKTTAIAIISRTPKHYFYAQGGAPSGEALIALEAPLNKKTQSHIDGFIPTWSEVAAFMLRLDGVEVDDNAVIPHFDKPETVQPYTQALIRKENTQAGIPLIWQLRQEGYTDEEIAQLEADQAAVQKQERDTLAQAMVDQQRNFDQGNNQGE